MERSGVGDGVHAVATWIESGPCRRAPGPLNPEQCRGVRFVLDVVDLLAARHGFDPATLVNPRTGRSLGPVLARLRSALEASEAQRGHEPPAIR